MTHLDVQAWLKANLDRKAREFGVPHWRISVVYERLEGPAIMTCETFVPYERATIRVDDNSYESDDTPESLEKDLEHELLHIAHSPFQFLKDQLYELHHEDRLVWNALASLFANACEMTVRNLERTVYGLRDAAKAKPEASAS